MRFVACALSLLLLTLPRACPADQQAGPLPHHTPALEPLPPTVDAVAAGLGRGSFEQRQQLMWRLWRQRATHGDAVRLASRDADPEVSGRATWIVERWKRGILPQLPAPLVPQIDARSAGDAFRQLLSLGQFDAATIAAEETLISGDRDLMADYLLALQAGFAFHARLATENRQTDQLAALVNQLALTAPMLVSRDQLNRLLSDRSGNPPAAADSAIDSATWLGDDAQAAAVLRWACRGQWDQARDAAERLGDRQLLRACYLLQGDWAELAAAERELAEATVAGSASAVQAWAYVLIAADRAGDQPLRQQAVEALSRPLNPPANGNEAAAMLQWRVLAMHGEIDAAVQLLTQSQPAVAAELLAQAGRVADAFAIAGVPHDKAAAAWPTLVQEAIQQARLLTPLSAQHSPEAVDRSLTVARLLYLTGRHDLAWEIYRRLSTAPSSSQLDDRLLAAAGGDLDWMQGYVLQAMYRINRVDWITRLMIDSGMPVNTGIGRHLLAHLFDVDTDTVAALAYGLTGVLRPDDAALAKALVDYLSGEIPLQFDPATDHRQLFATLSQSVQLPSTTLSGAMLERSRVQRLTLPLAQLFETHNQFSLAQETRIELAGLGVTEAVVELAEAELRRGQPEASRALFGQAWQRLLTLRQTLAVHDAGALDELVLRIVLGEALGAAAAGDPAAAAEHWQTLDWIACAPDPQLRAALGQRLLDHQFPDRAAEVYQTLLPMLLLQPGQEADFYNAARRLAQAQEDVDLFRAAQLLDLALVASLESTAFYPAGYVLFPALTMRSRALALIERGDETAARQATERLLNHLPIDIEFAENAIKKMRAHGMERLADETIERIYQAGQRHMQQFPHDSLMGNNLAWVMALSDHRLDEALQWSQRTVFSYPDSTIYRDTLAEVLFRLGRVDEAILLSEACLRDEPGEWHTHEQLQRFRAAPAHSAATAAELP